MCSTASPYGSKEAPRLRNAFEPVLAAVLELEARAGDEITRRRGHEHFAGSRVAGDARPDMHSDSTRLIAARTFDLTSVQPRPQLEAEVSERVADLERAADCACRPVEEGEESVAGH